MKIDKESESLPWQWMLDRDDAGIRDKAGKAVDRLIAFLDKNVESIVEWKESDQRKDMRSLFVSNATEFDNVIITPHIAGATRESIAKHTAMIAADLQRYVAGEPLLYQWR